MFFSTWRWEVEEVPQYFLENGHWYVCAGLSLCESAFRQKVPRSNAFAWLLRCKELWLQQATHASSLRPTEAAPHSGSPGSPWHYELVWASTALSISWSWRATTFCVARHNSKTWEAPTCCTLSFATVLLGCNIDIYVTVGTAVRIFV